MARKSIALIMFERGNGETCQHLINHAHLLVKLGHKVTAIIPPRSYAKAQLVGSNINIAEVNQLGHWDPIAKSNIKRIITQNRVVAVVTFGNRAVMLSQKLGKHLPKIGIAHHYRSGHLMALDYLIAPYKAYERYMTDLGYDSDNIFCTATPSNDDEVQKLYSLAEAYQNILAR